MIKTLFQFGPYVYSLIIITYIFLMLTTNFDLIIGRWALDMDEQILFDGLKRMFHYDSKEQLLGLFIVVFGQIMEQFFLI